MTPNEYLSIPISLEANLMGVIGREVINLGVEAIDRTSCAIFSEDLSDGHGINFVIGNKEQIPDQKWTDGKLVKFAILYLDRKGIPGLMKPSESLATLNRLAHNF